MIKEGRSRHLNESVRNVLITGGAGFIGSNLAARLLANTQANVCVFDNLSRKQVETNLSWLQTFPGAQQRLKIHIGDIRDAAQVASAAKGCSEIYHLAAQVAVTTSVLQPLDDFNVNALGTLNVLEAARSLDNPPFLLFTSTNKVYGSLGSLKVQPHGPRYVAENKAFKGISEDMPLDFHSPYGCSKGAADQYVHDYARIYDLPTIVFRMSCICGPRQFGTEDQGWVAHFLYSMLSDEPITIYGDGRQVRDVLHVDDLLDAMEAVRGTASIAGGNIFNVGGGMDHAVSVNEMITTIAQMTGRKPRITYAETRPGDQPLYISDVSKLMAATKWRPRRAIQKILEDIRNFGLTRSGLSSERETLLRAQAAEGMVA